MLQANTNTISFSMALFDAINENNLEVVKKILNRDEFATGEKIDAVLNEEGLSPMHLAASLGHLDIVQTLKEKGARVDLPASEHESMPIHFAAENGRLNVLRYLLIDEKVNPNVKNNMGLTCLHMAAIFGQLDVVKALVNIDTVDCNAKDLDEASPLFYAAATGKLAIVQFLISSGRVDCNPIDIDGDTMLHVAALAGHLNVVEWLIGTYKVDPNTKNNKEFNCLHYAVHYRHLAVTQWLINVAGMDPNVSTSSGRTILLYAVVEDHREIVEALVQTGVNISITLSKIQGALNKLNPEQYNDYHRLYEQFNYYHGFLSEINLVLEFFSYPSAETAQKVNQILVYLEKYKHLKLKNQQRKTLLELMLQNIIDKDPREIGILQEDKDRLLQFFVPEVIDKFSIDNTKNEEEQQKELERFLRLIERFVNAIDEPELKAKLFMKLGEKWNALMGETGNNYRDFIIEAYEKVLELSKEDSILEQAHLCLAYACLQLNNDTLFKANDERSQKAKQHAMLAGLSIDDAVRLRKQLYFGAGIHDEKEDPLVQELLKRLFQAIKDNNFEALDSIFAIEKFATGQRIDSAFNEDELSPMHLAASLGNLKKFKDLRLRNEQKKSLLDLVLLNIVDKSPKEIGVSEEEKDRVLMFFAAQVINDLHIDVAKLDTEQATAEQAKAEQAKAFEDFLSLIERLVNSIENCEKQANVFLELAKKFNVLRMETGVNYAKQIIDAYNTVLNLSKDELLKQMAHLGLAYAYLELMNSDVLELKVDPKQNTRKHAILAGQSDAAILLRKKLYYGIGSHDSEKDPIADLESQLNAAHLTSEGKLRIESKEALSNPKPGTVNEEEFQPNQSEAPTETFSTRTFSLFHAYPPQGAESILKKARIGLSTEPNEKGESATKKSRVEEDFEEDTNPNNNNNNMPRRRRLE